MSDSLAVVGKLLLYGGATIAIGSRAAQWARGATWSARPAHAPRRRDLLAWLAVMVALVVMFAAQFIALELLPTLTDVAMLVRQTAWGFGWSVLAITALLGTFATSVRAPPAIGSVIVLALAVGMSGLGHAAADDLPILARGLDTLHVVGVGAWIGLLWCAGSTLSREEWIRVSWLAGISAPLTLVSGAGSAVRRVYGQPVATIIASDYGRLLAIKLALVAIVLFLGWRNRNEIRATGAPNATRVRIELMVAIAVFVATSVLTGTAPTGE